jgi:hypothetical protein
MGLLDDAIRQHLELKRQHGASEEEVQRQEEEALGPARRDVAAAEPSGDNGELEAVEDAPVASEEETELFDPEASSDDSETALDEPEATPAVGAGEALEDDEPPEAEELFERDEEPGDGPDLEGVPAPDAMPESPAPFDAETAFEGFGERDDEEPRDEAEDDRDDAERDRDDPEPDSDDADVLEDTPDFLQETPEHDRLWFEQKPPRDFDFD